MDKERKSAKFEVHMMVRLKITVCRGVTPFSVARGICNHCSIACGIQTTLSYYTSLQTFNITLLSLQFSGTKLFLVHSAFHSLDYCAHWIYLTLMI